MLASLSWPKLFFYAVLALNAFFILRWALRSIRARLTPVVQPVRKLGKRKQAELARAELDSKKNSNPFAPRPGVADYIAPMIERFARKTGLVDDAPIMNERINAGSDSFFQMEEAARGVPPSERDRLRRLWAQSVHQSRKRARLPDVRKPADPGDGPLEPKPEP